MESETFAGSRSSKKSLCSVRHPVLAFSPTTELKDEDGFSCGTWQNKTQQHHFALHEEYFHLYNGQLQRL
jgi:hypothetical protein